MSYACPEICLFPVLTCTGYTVYNGALRCITILNSPGQLSALYHW